MNSLGDAYKIWALDVKNYKEVTYKMYRDKLANACGLLSNSKLHGVNLFHINCIEEFKEIASEIRIDPKFEEICNRQNNSYSAALKSYEAFLVWYGNIVSEFNSSCVNVCDNVAEEFVSWCVNNKKINPKSACDHRNELISRPNEFYYETSRQIALFDIEKYEDGVKKTLLLEADPLFKEISTQNDYVFLAAFRKYEEFIKYKIDNIDVDNIKTYLERKFQKSEKKLDNIKKAFIDVSKIILESTDDTQISDIVLKAVLKQKNNEKFYQNLESQICLYLGATISCCAFSSQLCECLENEKITFSEIYNKIVSKV